MSPFVLQRALRQPWLSLAMLAALVSVGAVLTASVLVAHATHDAATRAAVARAGDSAMLHVSRGVERPDPPYKLATIARLVADFADFEGSAVADVRISLRDRFASKPADLMVGALQTAGPEGGATTAITVRALREATLPLASGRAPVDAAGDREAALDEPTAAKLGVRIGDAICPFVTDDRAQSFCIRVVGIVRRDPALPNATLWAPIPTVFRVALDVRTGRALEQIDFTPKTADFAASDAPWLIAATRALRTRLHTNGWFVDTYLDDVIERSEQLWSRAASTLYLIAAVTALLAVYATAVVIAAVHRRQRDALRLWRMRGWERRRLVVFRALELGMLALAGLPLGIAAGAGAFRALSDVPPPRDLADALVEATLVSGTGLVLVACAGAAVAWQGLREGRTTRLQRGVPLTLMAYGLLALAVVFVRTRDYGVDPARSTEDLFLVTSGCAAAGAALLQLLPRALEAVGDLGVVGTLARAQLVRDFPQHARFATLAVFALATLSFAVTFAGTAAGAADDRAAYWAGAEQRVVLDPTAKPDFGAPSSDRSVEVLRAYGRASGLNADLQVLAIPAAWRDVTWWRDDLAAQRPAQLIDSLARAEKGGELLAAPDVRLWAFADRGAVHIELVGTDARATRCVADLGDFSTNAWEQHSAQLVCDAAPEYPVRVRRLDIRTSGATPNAHLSVSDLANVAANGETTSIVSFSEENNGIPTGGGISFGPGGVVIGPGVFGGALLAWWYTDARNGSIFDIARATDTVPRDGRRTLTLELPEGDSQIYIGPPPDLAPLPALASPGLLAALGVKAGTPFQVSVGRSTLDVVVIDEVAGFPTLYRGLGDFLILPIEPTLLSMARKDGDGAWPNEIWDPNGGGRVPDNASAVFERASLAATLHDEPLQRALALLLKMGALGAVLVAALAATLHFAVILDGRRPLDAILQAQGASRASLRASHLLEQGSLVICAAALGAVLGLLGAAIVTPTLRLGVTLQDVEPRALVRLQPVEAMLIALAVISLLAIVYALVRVRRVPELAEELRAL